MCIVYMCKCVNVYMYCVYVYKYMYIYIRLYAHACIHLQIYTCTYACVYIGYIHTFQSQRFGARGSGNSMLFLIWRLRCLMALKTAVSSCKEFTLLCLCFTLHCGAFLLPSLSKGHWFQRRCVMGALKKKCRVNLCFTITWLEHSAYFCRDGAIGCLMLLVLLPGSSYYVTSNRLANHVNTKC